MQHKENNPYVQSYKFFKSDYYIHQHVENIGRANNGNAMSQSELVALYSGKRRDALQAAKQQYKDLFKASIIQDNISPKAMQLITDAMKDDTIMKDINDQMGKRLSQVLAVDKLATLMKKELQADKTDFTKIINKEAMVDIESFNNILQALAEASQLIRNPTLGKNLAFYLNHVFNSKDKKKISRQEVGLRLQEQLQNFKEKAEGSSLTNFDIQQIKNICGSLNSLVRALKTGKTSNEEKDMTADGIKELIQNIFSTGFAQTISGEMGTNAYITYMNELQKVKFTGSETTRKALTNTEGRFKKFVGKKAYGKADVIFPNIKVKINKKGTTEFTEINISIGISDKFYKGAKFPGIEENQKSLGVFSSGAVGTVTENLKLIFHNNLRNMYLSYNTLAHGDSHNTPNVSEALQALQDIIVKRSLVYAFAARGHSDFAQFMFINGQIVPIWDIILSATNFVGKSASALKGKTKTPVYLTMENRPDLIKLMQPPIDDERTRVLKVNQAIRALKIKIELNLNALIKQGGKVFSKY